MDAPSKDLAGSSAGKHNSGRRSLMILMRYSNKYRRQRRQTEISLEMMKQLLSARLANMLAVQPHVVRKLRRSRKQQSQVRNPHGEASSGQRHDQHLRKGDGTRLF